MNKTRLKLLLTNCFATRARFSSSGDKSVPTHYETLEVEQRATQGDIKSSYFKLSKQYHPDKNTTEEAKKKFQSIANAYEVLGNYSSRKKYDRSLLTRSPYQKVQSTGATVDPKMEYYQKQAAIYRNPVHQGTMPTYDFDHWVKAHYGRVLQRTRIDKKDGTRDKVRREEDRVAKAQFRRLSSTVILVFFVGCMLLILVDYSEHQHFEAIIQESKNKEAPESNKKS